MKGLVVALALCAGVAQAQVTINGQRCDEPGKLKAAIRERYGERMLLRGLSDGGLLVEVLTSPKGTWTILEYHSPQLVCIVAFGNAAEVNIKAAGESI